MKLRGLTLAIQRIVWAEVALTAALGVPAYAQSQPTAATADAASATAAKPATATSASSPAATSGTVKQLQKFEVTGSLIRSSDKTGFNQVQTISQKDIEDSGSTTV